jgi:hypothetical protein
MDGTGTEKKLSEDKPGGRKEKGIPVLRGVYGFESDLRNTGVRIWRTKASDRTEWKAVVREAKVKLKTVIELKKEQNIC